MAELVSPCCGYEYSEQKDEDGYDIYLCEFPKCKEIFTEPLKDYEFDEQMKERIAEDKADEARDMGL